MRIIGTIILELAKRRRKRMDRWLKDPVGFQNRTLMELVRRAEQTKWGQRFRFKSIHTVEDFQKKVPLCFYEDFAPYWAQSLRGISDVTWPGKIDYFALTSGTTSGSKIIPVSQETGKSNQKAGLDTIVFYLMNTRDTHLFYGKFLFLGGSTLLRQTDAGTYMGDLSGIQSLNVPWYIKHIYSPGEEVARMANWEEKIVRIAEVASRQDVRAMSGIPSWLGILFNHVRQITGKSHIRDVWPNLRLLIHGGVDFSPYRRKFKEMLGEDCHFMEVYPASEGFVAMQDDLQQSDLLLMLDYNIFYEFVPIHELDKEKPTRLTLADIDTKTNYAIVMSTNSGLWAYVLGDTVRFTNLKPHKIRITGRTKHFLNAFGEHLIVEEVDAALTHACQFFNCEMIDYTVAPLYPEGRLILPAHQWLVEFKQTPEDLTEFAVKVDEKLQLLNEDYSAYRGGGAGMLLPEIVALPRGTFYEVMKRQGKLGGQNKVPRLQNNRDLADLVLQVSYSLGSACKSPASSDTK